MSEVVEAASVDNISPSAFTATTASAGNGVEISWVAPADHGIVGSFTLGGQTNFIYGVDKYEVYRKTGTGEFTLVGEATKGATQFVDTVAAGSTKAAHGSLGRDLVMGGLTHADEPPARECIGD
jgi:hypothetical protein